MAVYDVSIAAATAVVDYDLFQSQPWNVSEDDRVITGIALLGSGAALDTIVDFKVGNTTIARRYNRTTGAPNMDDVEPLNAFVPAGGKIAAIVVDAPATNPINAKIVVEDL